MTASKYILNYKLRDVVIEYAKQENIPFREAMDTFYKSDLYLLMVNGVADMHCRSEAYLAESLKFELIEKSEEQQGQNAPNEDNVELTMKLFIKELHKTMLLMPEHVKKESDGAFTPYNFFRVTVKDTAYCFNEVPKRLIECLSSLNKSNFSFANIAEKVKANPDDLRAFYKKYA